MVKMPRWGVLSTAGIGLRKVIPAMLKTPYGQIGAIASRDPSKAKEAAERFGIPRSYGSYEELLADPDIDAVYNPLPIHLHVEWTVKALEAGKHVLCEKPIALSANDAEELVSARERTGKQVLEAFMVRQHPQWLHARELVRNGEIGDVRLVQTVMSFFNDDPDNIRNRPEVGGGALYDIGCYAVLLGRFIFADEPKRAVSLIDRDPALGTDRLTGALVDFGEGRHLSFSCSTQLIRYQTVQIFGRNGRIEVPVSLNAPQGGETEIFVDRTGEVDRSGISRKVFAACDQYTLQAETAGKIFSGESSPEFPIEDAVANMRVIDAIYRSEKSGAWETI